MKQPFITFVDQILTVKSSPPLQGGVTEGRGGISGQPPRQTPSATPPYQGGEQVKAVDTSALEKQIDPVRNPIAKHLALDSSEISNGVDEMVYALYGPAYRSGRLTPAGIAIVEGEMKIQRQNPSLAKCTE